VGRPALGVHGPAPTRLTSHADTTVLVRHHLRWGWLSLLVFLTMGAVLEALHGFKVGYYLDVAHETRRHMWTLAHAHGTLLGLVHVALAATWAWRPDGRAGRRRVASVCLTSAGLLMPAGFLLGGVFIHAGDPGLGILLVPLGALLLFTAVALVAAGVLADPGEER